MDCVDLGSRPCRQHFVQFPQHQEGTHPAVSEVAPSGVEVTPEAILTPLYHKLAVPYSISMSRGSPPSSMMSLLILPASWARLRRSGLWLIVAKKCLSPPSLPGDDLRRSH